MIVRLIKRTHKHFGWEEFVIQTKVGDNWEDGYYKGFDRREAEKEFDNLSQIETIIEERDLDNFDRIKSTLLG